MDGAPYIFAQHSPFEHSPLALSFSPFRDGELITRRTPYHSYGRILNELELPILRNLAVTLEAVLAKPWGVDRLGFFYPQIETELLSHGDFQAVWASFQAINDTYVCNHLFAFRDWKFDIVQHYNAFSFAPRPSHDTLLTPVRKLIAIFDSPCTYYTSKHDRKHKQPHLFKRLNMVEPKDMAAHWEKVEMTVSCALTSNTLMTADEYIRVGQFVREIMRLNHSLKGVTERICQLQHHVCARVEKDRRDEQSVFAGLKAMERRVDALMEEGEQVVADKENRYPV